MVNAEGESMGGAFGFAGFVALFLVFNLVFLLFRFINYAITKKHLGLPIMKKAAAAAK